jgi:repressor LexA
VAAGGSTGTDILLDSEQTYTYKTGMPKALDISERVAQLKYFYQRSEGRAPSYAEMMSLFGYKSKNAVTKAVNRLVEAEYLKRYDNGRIGFTSKFLGGVPVLGSVQAGFPSPAEEELLDTVSLDEFLIAKPEATYLLTVSGDSMIEEGINPGDLVLVEKGGVPKQNDIVIAQIDGEWTMKFFGKDGDGKVYLDPANARYTRMHPEQSLLIGGIVKAVIRKYA